MSHRRFLWLRWYHSLRSIPYLWLVNMHIIIIFCLDWWFHSGGNPLTSLTIELKPSLSCSLCYFNPNYPIWIDKYITDRMICRFRHRRAGVGITQEFDGANYFFTLNGNAGVFQSSECTVFSTVLCFDALYNYFAICTMPVQLLHRQFGFSHKYINCSRKPFSQINTVSVALLR